MPKFSERYGYNLIEQSFQREAADKTLRLAIWNVLTFCMWDKWKFEDHRYLSPDTRKIDNLFRRMWFQYFKEDMDHLPPFRSNRGHKNGYDILKGHFLGCPWFEVYDMIEWFLQDRDSLMNDDEIAFLNNILERENSAYRVVGRHVAEITDENEIKAIEDALMIPEDPVRQHISRSLQLLSDREAPDYRNSIKESISLPSHRLGAARHEP
jgi:hypothetical protein